MATFTVIALYEGRISTRTERDTDTTVYADTTLFGIDQDNPRHDEIMEELTDAAEACVITHYDFDHVLFSKCMDKAMPLRAARREIDTLKNEVRRLESIIDSHVTREGNPHEEEREARYSDRGVQQ